MQYICKYQSPLGGITVSADGNSLTGLWFDGQKYFAATLPAAHEEKQLPVFDQTQRWLDCYFSGKNPGFTPPLGPEGSPFRQAVWEILLQIPYGETITYKDIAEEIARQQGKQTMSAQAIGGAVGHNPISIIIPCHRVVGSDGSLTGYAGGIPKKVGLLTLEQANMSGLFSSPFAPRCISMCQYEDRQSFRQKQIFYSIYFGGAFYHIRRNPSGRTIPPAPPLPAGRL